MSDDALATLVKSFLGKPSVDATAEECDAWKEFHRKYTRIAQVRIGNRRGWTDSDDLVQLVGILLIHRLKTRYFDPARGSLDGWIAEIVRDVVRRHTHRFSKHREEPLTPDLADELLDPEDGPDLEVERMLLREEMVDLLANLQARLHPRDHRIVVMRWVEDRSIFDIASELSLTDDCIRSALYRVSLKLREYLWRRGWGAAEKNVG